MSDSLVSVVVSTYNRPAGLARLLAGLREQTLSAGSFEVIVVDNGSAAPGTTRALESEIARGALQLRTLRHEQTLGPAGGRNSGWRLARAPLIAFIDDDCTPRPDWLEQALTTAREHPGAVVQGRTLPDPFEPDPGPELLTHTVRIERLGPQYETCNILYPRSALESLGGFDESFGLLPAGEDTDLAWRAIEAGWSVVFASGAVVHHEVARVGMRGMLRIAGRWGPAVRLFSEHNQVRQEMLYRGVFWNVWHYLLWRTLLTAAGPGWLRRLLITRYLLLMRRRAIDGGLGSWGVAYLLAHDAVECWAILRGAIAARTLVL